MCGLTIDCYEGISCCTGPSFKLCKHNHNQAIWVCFCFVVFSFSAFSFNVHEAFSQCFALLAKWDVFSSCRGLLSSNIVMSVSTHFNLKVVKLTCRDQRGTRAVKAGQGHLVAEARTRVKVPLGSLCWKCATSPQPSAFQWSGQSQRAVFPAREAKGSRLCKQERRFA